ncbi:MAG TPA: sigma-70 family RNA polymerase sigma factor [Euzebyales bacterium]
MDEEEGYERFFDSHYDAVRRAVTLATGDTGTAEDATAEAFARAYRRWARVSGMDDPRAWVYVVAMNVARRTYRRRRLVPWGDRDRRSSVDVAGEATDTAATTILLAGLTDRQRSAVVLRYLADLPYADVGRAMGCAESTARATVHQALTRLRAEVTEATDGS